MIVVGYQGVGKSYLAQNKERFIDLESSSFWVDGKRNDDWAKVYVNIAEHLSRQGYVVMMSSHKVVREELKKSKEIVAVAYPKLYMNDEWERRLQKRYNKTGLEKDYKALQNMKDMFAENIVDLMYDCKPHGVFEKIELDERDLYLSDYVITKIEGKYRK